MNELIPDKYNGNIYVEGNWDWSYSLCSPMEHYPDTLWIEGKNPGYIRYSPEIKAVGMVRISAYIIGFSDKQDKCVEYEIHHNSEIEKVYVDATKYGRNQSDWFVLGTFCFNGDVNSEFVQLNRVNFDGITRASTLRFEIINSKLENEVWQFIYIGPDRNNMAPIGLKKLDSFKDLDDCRYRTDIEQLALLNIINKNSDCFEPDVLVDECEFVNWLKNCQPIIHVTVSDELLTMKKAICILYSALMASGKNLEWLGETKTLTPRQLLEKADIIPKNLDKDDVFLSKADAAYFIKRYYHIVIATGVSNNRWKLQFSDDFSGEKLNKKIWECQNDAPAHILSSRWETNVKVEDGKMFLLTKKEKLPNCPNLDWTTASVSVRPDVFSQRYGYWEASIKINAAKGLNNAFWMALPGGNFEIDVVEAHYENEVNTNLHLIDKDADLRTQYTEKYKSDFVLSDDFHVYALEWNKDELIYYFDSVEISRKKNIGAHLPVYPIFSTAVLNWAGKIGDEADGKSMEVEWVRVYSEKSDGKSKQQ